jgi:hypothetical protein
MNEMKIARLNQVAELEISEGNWVEYSEGNYGVVTGVVEGPLEWPTDEDETEKVGESGEDVYVVARVSGGSKPFSADEIAEVDRETVIGDEDEMPDNPEEQLDEAEMAVGYKMISNGRVAELHHKPVAELLNVPGVEDPGVGFDSWPDSWEKAEEPARLIALDAWSSMQGTFTGCMAEIGSRRICAAFKDEILGTERWRNRF